MMPENFEKKINAAYARFTPVASRYYHTFTRPSVTLKGLPVALFLGNHSSGKSTLVNWIVGGEPLQDTGVAPTDDGFTVLMYGAAEEDVIGPAAFSRLPAEFHALETFGDSFKNRLKLKIRARETLKDKILVDSPGMIDSAEGTVARDYDFPGVVNCFARFSDMVFFLLDPEKPGTTGETVNVFSKCLTGMDYKLWVVLNKCDTIASVNDFARVYGTACWNLARILQTKDLPKIWTVYSGAEKDSPSAGMSFLDFNRHRAEFLALLGDMAHRRTDNLVASVRTDFESLSMKMRVINHVIARSRRTAALCFLYSLAFALLLAFALFWHLDTHGVSQLLATAVATLCGCSSFVIAHLICRPLARYVRLRAANAIDAVYERLYKADLVIRQHDDLSECWARIRQETADTLREAKLSLPFFAESLRRKLDKTLAKLLG